MKIIARVEFNNDTNNFNEYIFSTITDACGFFQKEVNAVHAAGEENTIKCFFNGVELKHFLPCSESEFLNDYITYRKIKQ